MVDVKSLSTAAPGNDHWPIEAESALSHADVFCEIGKERNCRLGFSRTNAQE
jgi:hypothetical protein